jgi:hypothetical protein
MDKSWKSHVLMSLKFSPCKLAATKKTHACFPDPTAPNRHDPWATQSSSISSNSKAAGQQQLPRRTEAPNGQGPGQQLKDQEAPSVLPIKPCVEA